MRAKPSARIRGIVFRVLTIVVLVVVVASLRSSEVHLDIGTAVTAVGPRSGVAARTAEDIRYQDSNLELIAVYRVIDGHLEESALAEHRRIWTIAEATLPAVDLNQIRQLNIVTDGPARTLAMVHRSTTEHDSWILSVDFAESQDVLERTLIHELGHLYTLGEPDLTSQRTNCAGILLEIGCARTGSLLADYASRFWSGVSEPAAHSSDTFVTQYAAESVHEDLAETFLFWVYGDKAPSNTIAAKYRWFETTNTFVVAKAEIRTNLQMA